MLMVEPTENESRYEPDRFCDAMISIRAEMTAVETGAADAKNNLLKNVPHTADQITSDNWNRPYTRAGASRTGMRRSRPRACTTTNSGRTSRAWTMSSATATRSAPAWGWRMSLNHRWTRINTDSIPAFLLVLFDLRC
jgi:hypothetical protein